MVWIGLEAGVTQCKTKGIGSSYLVGKTFAKVRKNLKPGKPGRWPQQQNVNPDLFHDFLNNFAILAVDPFSPRYYNPLSGKPLKTVL